MLGRVVFSSRLLFSMRGGALTGFGRHFKALSMSQVQKHASGKTSRSYRSRRPWPAAQGMGLDHRHRAPSLELELELQTELRLEQWKRETVHARVVLVRPGRDNRMHALSFPIWAAAHRTGTRVDGQQR